MDLELSSTRVAVWDPLTVSWHAEDAASAVVLVTDPSGRELRLSAFQDAEDGTTARTRIMPTGQGQHHVGVKLRGQVVGEATFHAQDEGRKGVLRARDDSFVWSGTGEPFFWNATTSYLLAGLEESVAKRAIDRLAEYGVNRLRVALCPTRQKDGGRWMEAQVTEREDFTFCYGPWVAGNPSDPLDPQYDVEHFDLDHWRKFERLVDHARLRDVVVQVIFFVDAQEPQNYPFDRDKLGDDPWEQRYYEYAVARLAGFSNVEWCITNEWALFRPDEWVEAVGAHLRQADPYGHLISVHGHGHFPFAQSDWCTHQLYQVWDEHGAHDWALARRAEQATVKPIVNDEFGYEDHYSYPWGEGRVYPARNAESRARLAWEMVMGGVWPTTGETAKSGDGGWINGWVDGPSNVFELHAHLLAFFQAFEWWKTQPHDELVSGHAYCRAEVGRQYAVYVYGGGSCSLMLPPGGKWSVESFDPATGAWARLKDDAPLERQPGWPGYVCPHVPFGETRAFLVRAVE